MVRFRYKTVLLGMVSLLILPAGNALAKAARVPARAAMDARDMSILPQQATPWANYSTTKWDVDSHHSAAFFYASYMGVVDVEGSIVGVTGSVEINHQDFNKSKVEVKIPAKTISTNNAQRDQDLRSADFLDVQNHEWITFKSKSVERVCGASDMKLKICGDLTIRGKKNKECFMGKLKGPSVDPKTGNQIIGFTAEHSIDRSTYGVGADSKAQKERKKEAENRVFTFAKRIATKNIISNKVKLEISAMLTMQEGTLKKGM
ncbi:MAG: YceI family protein [Myxococcota bacterium]